MVAPAPMSNIVPGSKPIAATTTSRGATPGAQVGDRALAPAPRPLGGSAGSAAAAPS